MTLQNSPVMSALLYFLFVSGVVMASEQSASSAAGLFQPCPDSPNCVSSQEKRERHAIDPIYLGTAAESGWKRLQEIIANTPRTTIVRQSENYLHAEVRSRLFGFVDDLEILFDRENKIAHIRSASRSGTWDLGVNRKRLERLRHELGNISP